MSTKTFIYIITIWVVIVSLVSGYRYFKQQKELEALVKISSGIVENQALMQDNMSDIVKILKDIAK